MNLRNCLHCATKRNQNISNFLMIIDQFMNSPYCYLPILMNLNKYLDNNDFSVRTGKMYINYYLK